MFASGYTIAATAALVSVRTVPYPRHVTIPSHALQVSAISRNRRIVDRIVAAAGVDTVYAPPAIVWDLSTSANRSHLPSYHRVHTFLQARQFQIPVE